MDTKRIILIGHFGAGNLGNECTLQAVIERTLQRWPQTHLQCACTDPKDVEARHNISAICWKPVLRAPASQKQVTIGQRASSALVRIIDELMHIATCIRVLRQNDMLIVCGTGIVCDYLTGPRGWPYILFKWSALAALSKVKILFLGVGVGPIYHPFSRWLIKRSLGFAAYRSYRDEASKQYLQGIGFSTARDAVCPDLVFGLSEPLSRSISNRRRIRPVIGLGLKDYDLKSSDGNTNTYQDYLVIMIKFIGWLCEHGYNVRLLVGDFQHDIRATEDIVDAIKGQCTEEGQVVAEPARTIEELMQQLDETDIVISPRFHNLVLALSLNRPVIALSDHPKLDSLMTEIGLADYCLSLENLDIVRLIKLFQQLQNDAGRVKAYIQEKTEKYHEALDRQYAAAFGMSE
jgi:polysaccharide pyruvyl transferase WcaK-like protein